MFKYIIPMLFAALCTQWSFGQSLDDLEQYTVEQFYKKIDLDYGTLDEDGDDIDYIYVETEVDPGNYEVELTDADGDLYEIKGTNLYVTFRGYFGYAGYGTECILQVESYSATVYKLEK